MQVNTETNYKLTQYTHGGGCGCKIEPETLRKILGNNQTYPGDFKLLVGNDTNDDAAVYDLENGNALISTVDFFMPVVDDAYSFGRIAAANAISDVYAMGGTPVLAIAILGWNIEKIPSEIAQKVIAGGRSICAEAGIALAGGHSVESPEPFFGLAVNGLIKKENIKRNNTAQVGDLLYLTKPLGLGIITTAARRELVKPEDLEIAIQYMCALNKIGTALSNLEGITAMTDVTGFGLLGHLIEMAEGSDLSARISFDEIPVIDGLDYYTGKYIFPDMTTKNFSAYSNKVNELSAQQLLISCDPQTSGGLLIAVKPGAVNEYMEVVKKLNLQNIAGKSIGMIIAKKEVAVEII